MKKLLLLNYLLVVISITANTQPIQFPKVEECHVKYMFDIKEEWTPSEEFMKANPRILLDGSFVSPNVKFWNSKTYPAVLVKNEQSIVTPGRIYVMFNGDEMPDLDGSQNKTHPTGYDYNIITDKESHLSACKTRVFSNEGLVNIIGKRGSYTEAYNVFNQKYNEDITAIFADKGKSDIVVLPYASASLSKEDLKASDLIVEFSLDTMMFIGSKIVRKKVFDEAVLYKMTVRDCAGKILKTYGQTIFVSIVPITSFGASITNFDSYIEGEFMNVTYKPAISCLLNQFTGDNTLKQEIAKRITALKIQAATDKTIIHLYKLKTEALQYRHCQMNILNELSELNRAIVNAGGSGVDISGVKMPANTNPNLVPQTTYNLVGSAAASVAGLGALIANEVDKATVRRLEKEAEVLKDTFPAFVEKEEKAVAAYNKLVGSGKITDVNQIGNPGLANNMVANRSSNQIQGSTANMESFWDEGANKKGAGSNGNNVMNYSDNNTFSAAEQTSVNTKYTKADPEENVSNEPVYHKVVSGETLYRIALTNNVSVEDLKNWNDLKNGLKTGMYLVVGNSGNKNNNASAVHTTANNAVKPNSNSNNASTKADPDIFQFLDQLAYQEQPVNNTNTQSGQKSNNFWDDNGITPKTNSNSNSSSQESAKPLATLATSTELQNQVNDLGESVSQNAQTAITNIKASEQASANWMNSTVQSYAQANQQAATAGRSGSNTSGGGANHGTCPAYASQREALMAEAKRCQTSACNELVQAKAIKLYQQLCSDHISPEMNGVLNKGVNQLNGVANSLQGGGQFAH